MLEAAASETYERVAERNVREWAWNGQCITGGMRPAHRFEELACWQLSVDLRDRVQRLLDTDVVRGDPDFHQQTSAAAASAPRNLAEGFARFKPRQFAYMTRIALASLAETRNQLLNGIGRRYWTIDQVRDLLFLEYRAARATTALLAYLDSCKGESPTGCPPESPTDEPRKPSDRKP